MTMHMEDLSLDDTIAVLTATPNIMRRVTDDDGNQQDVSMSLEEATAIAALATRRHWAMVAPKVFDLRMETVEQVYWLPTVSPL